MLTTRKKCTDAYRQFPFYIVLRCDLHSFIAVGQFERMRTKYNERMNAGACPTIDDAFDDSSHTHIHLCIYIYIERERILLDFKHGLCQEHVAMFVVQRFRRRRRRRRRHGQQQGQT